MSSSSLLHVLHIFAKCPIFFTYSIFSFLAWPTFKCPDRNLFPQRLQSCICPIGGVGSTSGLLVLLMNFTLLLLFKLMLLYVLCCLFSVDSHVFVSAQCNVSAGVHLNPDRNHQHLPFDQLDDKYELS